MTPDLWRQIGRLVLNKASLNRVLTEIELERLGHVFLQNKVLRRVLIAGGTYDASGSEKAFLVKRDAAGANLISVNLNRTARPHVMADLACPWPFRDEMFDLIIPTWVLEHLKDPMLFFREAHRTLMSGGSL